MPYRCAKYERNCTMGRLFLCDLKILQKQCEEEGEEKLAIFGSVYLVYH